MSDHKNYKNGQTIHIIESDGIALGHYLEWSEKKQSHKVDTSTSSNDYKLVEDELLTENYQDAKEKLLSNNFKNQHFNDSYY